MLQLCAGALRGRQEDRATESSVARLSDGRSSAWGVGALTGVCALWGLKQPIMMPGVASRG